MLEHLKLAKMSFDLWGALSPTSSESRSAEFGAQEQPSVNDSKPSDAQEQINTKRSMSQAELESSLYKVLFDVFF